MSKQIKQMEMDALKETFQDVRDMVLISAHGLSAMGNHQLRMGLRKKNIRLQMVKNSLARRVFGDLGLKIDRAWTDTTLVAWGTSSLAELSRELDGLIKKNDKIKVKTAVSEGQEITFDRAKTMPTREEAIGRIVSLALSPATRLVSQIMAPGARLAAQVQTRKERPAEGAPAEAAPTSQASVGA
jgi:large subunit ribosomal protein L10